MAKACSSILSENMWHHSRDEPVSIRRLVPPRANRRYQVAVCRTRGLGKLKWRPTQNQTSPAPAHPTDSQPNLGSTPAAAAAVVVPLEGSANGAEASAAAELDSPRVGDEDYVVDEDSGVAVSVSSPSRAADGRIGDVEDPVSAMNTGGCPTSRPDINDRAAGAAVGAAWGAVGVDAAPSAGRESQPEGGIEAAVAEEPHRQAHDGRRSNPVDGVTVRGDGQRVVARPQEPTRQPVSASSASLAAVVSMPSGCEPAVATPLEGEASHVHRHRGPSDVFSVGSMPPSVGDEREGRGAGGGTDAEPVLSGEESTSKSRRSGRSSGRKAHKHRHKRSHRHRDKSSDEGGGGRSRRRRSRDHGGLGSTGASTNTALAPLKRIPPPSLASAQRGIGQGDGPVGEASASDGDDGGGGG